MLDKLKQEALRNGMKLIANPRVMKMLSDPRFMEALNQFFAIKGQLQSELESKFRQLAGMLNLATREEVETLRQSLTEVESCMTHLQKKVDS
jgi:hypothetical protein